MYRTLTAAMLLLASLVGGPMTVAADQRRTNVPRLPQDQPLQQHLYAWLETVTIEDVTLPEGEATCDGHYESADHLADLWLALQGTAMSRVTRGELRWYVLDDGEAAGIEAAAWCG